MYLWHYIDGIYIMTHTHRISVYHRKKQDFHNNKTTYLHVFNELYVVFVKGIVHLNIIFSYMKFNKICNLDHPVY